MKTLSTLPRVGIIGGAGPMAGLQLVQKIIQICQEQYGCENDADFPYVMLLSYPFADMLQRQSTGAQRPRLEAQLNECMLTFAKQDVSVTAIACNTLHAFLSPSFGEVQNFVHMIEQTSFALQTQGISRALILCTETSAKAKVHAQKFPCIYLEERYQKDVDAIIQRILAGKYLAADAERLAQCVNAYATKEASPLGVILGCTELPLLNDRFPLSQYGLENCVIVDPMTVVAKQICKIIFKK